MRVVALLCAGVALLAAACAPKSETPVKDSAATAAPPVVDVAAVRQGIEQANAKFIDAMIRGDSAGMLANYADDAVLMVSGWRLRLPVPIVAHCSKLGRSNNDASRRSHDVRRIRRGDRGHRVRPTHRARRRVAHRRRDDLRQLDLELVREQDEQDHVVLIAPTLAGREGAPPRVGRYYRWARAAREVTVPEYLSPVSQASDAARARRRHAFELPRDVDALCADGAGASGQ